MSDATTPTAVRPLRHAATMLLLREHEGDIEVLMTHRHADLAFMGGMWVFPGGTLSPADQSEPAHSLLASNACAFKLYDLKGDQLPGQICRSLAIAACRETFEEAGVLLARNADGAALDSAQLDRLQRDRPMLARDPALFIETLVREGMRLDVDRMIYWSHWITPSGVPRRFDTRFFVARAPETHTHTADTYETTECTWMTPHALLESWRRGEMKIAQPTRYNLEDLRASIEEHGTLDALLSAEATREVAPILPKMFERGGKTVIAMPWDAGYAEVPGEGVRADQRYEPALLQLAAKMGTAQ